jgi:hypothetical protein
MEDQTQGEKGEKIASSPKSVKIKFLGSILKHNEI